MRAAASSTSGPLQVQKRPVKKMERQGQGGKNDLLNVRGGRTEAGMLRRSLTSAEDKNRLTVLGSGHLNVGEVGRLNAIMGATASRT